MAKAKLDKYYTPDDVIRVCSEALSEVVDDKMTLVIEPAAGDGRWLQHLRGAGFNNIALFDIAPDCPSVVEFDFLKGDLRPEIYGHPKVFVTNPPFGRACSLAIQFFNKAAGYDPDVIAFLIPRSFGKKLQARRRMHPGYILHSITEIPKTHFERPDGVVYEGAESRVECEFQIWVKGTRAPVKVPEPIGYKILRPANKKVTDAAGVLRELPVGEIGADFTIVTHGTKAGMIEDFDPVTNKVSVRQFVKVEEGYTVEEIRKKFENTDFSYFATASTIGAQGSINTDEIICCVEGVDFKLKSVV